MVTIDQPIIYKNKYNVAYVVYESKNELFDGKKSTTLAPNHSLEFTPPKFISTSNNAYEINAYAVDVKGNRSNTVKLNVAVFNNSDENGDNNTVGPVYEKNSSIWFEVNGEKTNEVRSYEKNVKTIVVKLKLHDENDKPVKLNKVEIQMERHRDEYFTCEAVSNKEGEYDCNVTDNRWGIEQFEYLVTDNIRLTTEKVYFYWDKIKWDLMGNPNKPGEEDIVQFVSTRQSFKGTSLSMYTLANDVVSYKKYNSGSPFDFHMEDKDPPYNMVFSGEPNVDTKTCLFTDYECEVY